jgi:hypothetical protein
MEEGKKQKRAATAEQQETKNASNKKPRQQSEPLTATPTDVFAKHPYLFVPFLDRVSLNRLFSTNKEIHEPIHQPVSNIIDDRRLSGTILVLLGSSSSSCSRFIITTDVVHSVNKI